MPKKTLATLFLSLPLLVGAELALAANASTADTGQTTPPTSSESSRSPRSSPGSTEQTLQRVEAKIDGIANTVKSAKHSYIDEPLHNKTYGVEFNVARLLFWDDESMSLSGTYSRFDLEDKVEIAVPIMYSSGEHDEFGYDRQDSRLKSLTVDLHYRKFLGHNLDGFYISGFTRVAHLSGLLDSDQSFNDDSFEEGSETKLGVGAGVGYRIFSDSGWYWGASLSVGRYLLGDSDKFLDSVSLSAEIDDEEFIWDVEFFKFGYAF